MGGDSFHLGDLGNIPVGMDGTGYIERTTDLWDLGTGSESWTSSARPSSSTRGKTTSSRSLPAPRAAASVAA